MNRLSYGLHCLQCRNVIHCVYLSTCHSFNISPFVVLYEQVSLQTSIPFYCKPVFVTQPCLPNNRCSLHTQAAVLSTVQSQQKEIAIDVLQSKVSIVKMQILLKMKFFLLWGNMQVNTGHYSTPQYSINTMQCSVYYSMMI